MASILSEVKSLIKFSFSHPLNTTLALRWQTLLRVLRWLLLTRIHCGPIIIKYIDDTQLILQRGISAREPYFHMLNEPFDMSFLLHVADETCMFVDVGANVGAYTLLACVAGADCIALEPARNTFKVLKDNIKLNGCEGKTTLLRLAAGAEKGTCRMTADTGPTNRVLGASTGDHTIEMTTLDEIIIRQNKSYIVKIDVEGFEEEVLLGAQRSLAEYDVIAVIIESAGNEKNYGKTESKVAKIMATHGYVQCCYEPITRHVTQLTKQISENIIYIKDIDRIQQRATKGRRFQVGEQSI